MLKYIKKLFSPEPKTVEVIAEPTEVTTSVPTISVILTPVGDVEGLKKVKWLFGTFTPTGVGRLRLPGVRKGDVLVSVDTTAVPGHVFFSSSTALLFEPVISEDDSVLQVHGPSFEQHKPLSILLMRYN